MTAAIKRMLAERAMLEAGPPPKPRDPMVEILRNAAPFVDEGWNGKGWKPSEIMLCGYFMYFGAWPDGPALAARWAEALLERARRRYRDGYLANPFGEAVRA